MEKSTNLDDLCRLCGELGSQIIPVFGDEERSQGLKEKIESNVKVTVSEFDELPKGICSGCNEKLCNICNFVRQCQETQEKLQEFLSIQQSLWLVESESQDQEVSTEDNFDFDDAQISHHIDISTFESNEESFSGNVNTPIPDTFTCIVTKPDDGLSEKDMTQCLDMPNLLQEERADGNALLRFPTVEAGSPLACASEDSTVLSVDAASVANGRGNIRFQRSATGMKIVFPPSTSADTVNFTDLMRLFSLPEVKSMFTASQDSGKVPTPIPSPLSSTCDSFSWDISQLLDMEEELEKGRCGRAMTPLEVTIPDEQPISGINSALSLFEDWNLGISPVLDLDPNVATVGVVTEQPPETKEVSIEFIVPSEKDKKFKRPPPDAADEHITELSPTVFKCKICDEKFRWRYKCQRHVRTHTGEKPYICGVCGKSFTVKYYLDRHVKSHDESSRIRCKFCGKSFSRPHLLKEHEDGHKGLASLECSKCARRFHSKQGFQQHVCGRLQPKLVCDVCGGTFAGALALRHHRARHEAARFRCPRCPAMYHTRYELDRHVRRHRNVPTATSTSTNVPILPNPTATNAVTLPNPTVAKVAILPNPTVAILPNPTVAKVAILPNPTVANVATLPNPTVANVATLPNSTVTNAATLPNSTVTNAATLPNPTVTNAATLPNPTVANVASLPNPTVANVVTLPNTTVTNVATLPDPTNILSLPNPNVANVQTLPNPTVTNVLTFPNAALANVLSSNATIASLPILLNPS